MIRDFSTTLRESLHFGRNDTKDMNINLKKRKWVYYGAAGYPAYITPFIQAPSRDFSAIYGTACEGVIFWHGKTFDWIYDEEQLLSFSSALLPKLLEDPWKAYEAWQSMAEVFVKEHELLMQEDLSSLSEDELKLRADRYYGSYIKQYAHNNWIEPLSYYFQMTLKGALVGFGLNDKEIDERMAFYSLPARKNYLKQCAEEYLALKGGDASGLLAKYHYLNNNYTGCTEVTEKDLMGLAESYGHENVSEVVPAFPQKSADASRLLEVLRVTATIQDVRKAYSLMWVSGAHRLLAEYTRRKGLELSDLVFGFWDEIWSEDISPSELAGRKDLFVAFFGREDRRVIHGDQASLMQADLDEYVIGVADGTKEVRGTPASGGKIRGRVCVVTNISHFNKIKPGDILVSVMTRPEYLPLMKLASAFVTDEGGLTCHAAIVAREMGKPCIIGTKNASRALKDGDIVEVDADQGIVTLIVNS
jgi:phosphohistidine swiveling domain-containing protein